MDNGSLREIQLQTNLAKYSLSHDPDLACFSRCTCLPFVTPAYMCLSPLSPVCMYGNTIRKISYDAALSSSFCQLKSTCGDLCSLLSLTCMISRRNSFTCPRSWIIVLHDPNLSASTLGRNLFTQAIRSPHNCVRKSPSFLLHSQRTPHKQNSFFASLCKSPTLVSHQNSDLGISPKSVFSFTLALFL